MLLTYIYIYTRITKSIEMLDFRFCVSAINKKMKVLLAKLMLTFTERET